LKFGDYTNPRKKKLTFRHFEKNCQEFFKNKIKTIMLSKEKKNWMKFYHLATQNNSTLFYDQ
jgi:hypothetical protein